MDKIEKIIEILENQDISSVEKEYLAEESKNDNEVKDFITFYNKFIKSLRSSTHLELLVNIFYIKMVMLKRVRTYHELKIKLRVIWQTAVFAKPNTRS